jgi:hypothetical protein
MLARPNGTGLVVGIDGSGGPSKSSGSEPSSGSVAGMGEGAALDETSALGELVAVAEALGAGTEESEQPDARIEAANTSAKRMAGRLMVAA